METANGIESNMMNLFGAGWPKGIPPLADKHTVRNPRQHRTEAAKEKVWSNRNMDKQMTLSAIMIAPVGRDFFCANRPPIAYN